MINDMSTAVMWSTLKPDVEFNMADVCAKSMACHPRATHYRVLPLGEFSVTIPEPHATLQGVRIPSAILKIVFAIFYYFVFNTV